MKPEVGLTLEQAIEIATRRTLPAGYKPEDYLIVNDKIPLKIASIIVKEAIHLMKMSEMINNYGS
jgi:hypothetical protein